MKSRILLNKNFFIYKKEKYLNEEFYKIKEKLHSTLKIIILEEELNVNYYNIKLKRNKLSDFVSENIKNNFPQNGDVLYDYEYDKKKQIMYIYYIKGGRRISGFIENANNLEIKPIQFLIKSVLRNKFKIKDRILKSLIKINEYYYYIILEDNIIKKSLVEKNKEIIMKNMDVYNSNYVLYVDNNILDNIKEENINLVNFDIMKGIYEEIESKQKLYSRRIL